MKKGHCMNVDHLWLNEENHVYKTYRCGLCINAFK